VNIIVGTDKRRTLSQDKMYFNSDNWDEYLAAFRQNFQTFCSTDPERFPTGKDM
jgi:hypothetical protein